MKQNRLKFRNTHLKNLPIIIELFPESYCTSSHMCKTRWSRSCSNSMDFKKRSIFFFFRNWFKQQHTLLLSWIYYTYLLCWMQSSWGLQYDANFMHSVWMMCIWNKAALCKIKHIPWKFKEYTLFYLICSFFLS